MSYKFYHLDNLPPLPEHIIEEGLTSNFQYIEFPVSNSATSVLFKNSKFYKLLLDQFGQADATFLKTPPMTIYNWHMDKGRRCAINWIIKTNPRALTLFKDNPEWQAIHKVEEVDYIMYKPTLINTTYKHCVINCYPEERIILSVSINEKYSFDEFKEFLQSLDIKEY